MKNILSEIKEAYKKSKDIAIYLDCHYIGDNDKLKFLLKEIKKFAKKNKIVVFRGDTGCPTDFSYLLDKFGKNFDLSSLEKILDDDTGKLDNALHDWFINSIVFLLKEDNLIGIIDMDKYSLNEAQNNFECECRYLIGIYEYEISWAKDKIEAIKEAIKNINKKKKKTK